MAFEPGKSGNPAGRPKQADLEAVDLSILRALRKVVRRNPRLIEEAIQRRLESRDNFGMIEMIAKLTKELGNQEEQRSQIAIIFNGTLNQAALKQVDAKVIECQVESKDLALTNDLSSTTSPDQSQDSSSKTAPSVVDSTVPSEQASLQPE
jgi:hypothetical protein